MRDFTPVEIASSNPALGMTMNGSLPPTAASGRVAAAQLEAGQAAVNAGAINAGLECLRRAVADACGDTGLRLEALNALGGALVHGVRGRDEEGAAIFHEALAEADKAGDQAAAARAARELGFVDVQAGRRQRAEVWLARAEAYAVDDLELASVLGVQGMKPLGHGAVRRRARRARAVRRPGPGRGLAASGRLVGVAGGSHPPPARGHRPRRGSARGVDGADPHRALDGVRPVAQESLLAEVDRTTGDTDRAADRYAHAFALACQLGDPCWEGVAARG